MPPHALCRTIQNCLTNDTITFPLSIRKQYLPFRIELNRIYICTGRFQSCSTIQWKRFIQRWARFRRLGAQNKGHFPIINHFQKETVVCHLRRCWWCWYGVKSNFPVRSSLDYYKGDVVAGKTHTHTHVCIICVSVYGLVSFSAIHMMQVFQ